MGTDTTNPTRGDWMDGHGDDLSDSEEKLNEAIDDLREGKPVVVYDFGDREGEADLVYASETVGNEDIARLRNEAGGLICTAIPSEAAEEFGLPFLSELVEEHDDGLVEKPEYGSRSSFSLWVNHRSNYTGVTDNDRSKTARKLAEAVGAVADGGEFDFAEEFSSPGHMAVLRADDELLDGRKGHTEMSVALVGEAGLTPVATISEMLDAETGEALSRRDAEEYAETNGLVFLTGDEVVSLL
ncbi:MAG: 3,4-dihydroxy-2-butanone-4-phosphate synthase [Halobacteria archaeon]|nr:3,4-dihydroxy-2-butanone-4-phosphate synthase [Halobacteria archaeon]